MLICGSAVCCVVASRPCSWSRKSMHLVIGQRPLEDSRRTIVLDNTTWSTRAMNLDHHVGSRTPPEWRGAVATEVALRAIEGGLDLASFRRVSIRHYDTD